MTAVVHIGKMECTYGLQEECLRVNMTSWPWLWWILDGSQANKGRWARKAIICVPKASKLKQQRGKIIVERLKVLEEALEGGFARQVENSGQEQVQGYGTNDAEVGLQCVEQLPLWGLNMDREKPTQCQNAQ